MVELIRDDDGKKTRQGFEVQDKISLFELIKNDNNKVLIEICEDFVIWNEVNRTYDRYQVKALTDFGKNKVLNKVPIYIKKIVNSFKNDYLKNNFFDSGYAVRSFLYGNADFSKKYFHKNPLIVSLKKEVILEETEDASLDNNIKVELVSLPFDRKEKVIAQIEDKIIETDFMGDIIRNNKCFSEEEKSVLIEKFFKTWNDLVLWNIRETNSEELQKLRETDKFSYVNKRCINTLNLKKHFTFIFSFESGTDVFSNLERKVKNKSKKIDQELLPILEDKNISVKKFFEVIDKYKSLSMTVNLQWLIHLDSINYISYMDDFLNFSKLILSNEKYYSEIKKKISEILHIDDNYETFLKEIDIDFPLVNSKEELLLWMFMIRELKDE